MKKIILICTLLISSTLADFNLTYTLGNKEYISVYYKDDKHVKVTTVNKQQNIEISQLIIGKKHYMIFDDNINKKYIDMDIALNKLDQFSKIVGQIDIPKENIDKPSFKILEKKANKKVAQIDAQEWLVEIVTINQKTKLKLLVTDNKEFVKAIKQVSKAMKSFGIDKEENIFSSFLEVKKGHAVVAADDIKLLEFNKSKIESSLFTLPQRTQDILADTTN